MMNWLNEISTSSTAPQIAILFAFISAICHAIYGAMQKGQYDPILIRAAGDFWFLVFALPLVLIFIPWPSAKEWWLIAGIFPIHTTYKLVLAQAYRAGDYSFIYPIARGSSPFFTALLGTTLFHESLKPLQWLGVLIISIAIIGMGLEALSKSKLDKSLIRRAAGFSLMTGALITLYSLYDAYGVRNSRSPYIFLAWFYIADGWFFPLIILKNRFRYMPVNGYAPLLKKGFFMSIFGFVSFGLIFLASDIGHVGEIFAIRETSVIWAALFGSFFLREPVSGLRFVSITIIALGAIMITLGSHI